MTPAATTPSPVRPAVISATPWLGGRVVHAACVAAGPWVFVTGVMASSDEDGMPVEAVDQGHPRWGVGLGQAEAGVIWDRLEQKLQAAGSDLSRVVRLDQFYTDGSAIDPYHTVRRERLGGNVPPSTSIIQDGLLLPDSHVEVSAVALRADAGGLEPLDPESVVVPPESGFAPALRAGGLVFAAGVMANDAHGIAPAARLSPGAPFSGTQIGREMEYLLERQLIPALQAAGTELEDVVKAQVYLADIDDVPGFNRAWRARFGDRPPATTIVPARKLGFPAGAVEVNAIAVPRDRSREVEVVDASRFAGYEGHVSAIRVGDLLFVSGLSAIDRHGLAASASLDPRTPHYGSAIELQMEHVLETAEQICALAGTDLGNVVRAQHFLTDLGDAHAAIRTWERYRPGAALPFSAVQVPGPLPVPGTRVVLDLWVYVGARDPS